MRLAQHIKRHCNTAIFNAHLSGERGLELHLDNLNLEVGDLITFVEVDEQGTKTGRTFSRKVVQLEQSSKLKVGTDEATRHGFVAIGLQAPEFNTLRLAFNNRFLLGAVLECAEGVWKILNQAQCWPMLIAPDLTSSGLLQQLHLDQWPDGIYVLHLMVPYEYHHEEKRLELEIEDSLVMAFCESPPGSTDLEGVEIELNALMVGKVVGTFDGLPWTPARADYVKEYFGKTAAKHTSLQLYSSELDETQFRDVLEQQPAPMSEENNPPWNST